MKLLFLGLDGFDPDVAARLIAGGRLPALASIAAAGSLGRVLSTLPPATMPAWATCLTGACPGRHGVFDFARLDGYAVRFGTRRAAAPTFLETTAAAGLRVGSLGFPGRFGRDGLAFHVAGWDTPLDVAAHVSPAGLHDRIVGRFGARALRFAAADEHRTSGDGGWSDRFAAALGESVGVRAALASWLAREFRLDVLAVHFQAADTAGHHLIGTQAMDDVYAAVDGAVGLLAGSLEPDAVIAVSDHGMGPASGVVVSINALLERAGFLRNRRSSVRAAAGRVLRRAGLYALP
ncbi:MAG: alkaline phosphatase family protein, partial [Myxococcota bacterium]|nr:alkaline phosphatase family protein [Myxococcota bacterium]